MRRALLTVVVRLAGRLRDRLDLVPSGTRERAAIAKEIR